MRVQQLKLLNKYECAQITSTKRWFIKPLFLFIFNFSFFFHRRRWFGWQFKTFLFHHLLEKWLLPLILGSKSSSGFFCWLEMRFWYSVSSSVQSIVLHISKDCTNRIDNFVFHFLSNSSLGYFRMGHMIWKIDEKFNHTYSKHSIYLAYKIN